MKNLIVIIILISCIGCVAKESYKIETWDGGVLTYYFDDSMYDEPEAMEGFKKAFTDIESRTKVTFYESAYVDDHTVLIYISEACRATIGKVEGPFISVKAYDNPDELMYVIYHEIFHVLGFAHEQQRPDRNFYIDINWNNIATEYKSEFHIQKPAYNMFKYKYDYKSIMHYNSYTYSNSDEPTMLKYSGKEIKRNLKPSIGDWSKLNDMYKETEPYIE